MKIKFLDGTSREVALAPRANLHEANLGGANLTGANLHEANLTGANLTGAYLGGANLTGAYLTGANLHGANLSRANLTGANLHEANLGGANLTGANLTGANLHGANLTGAYLGGAYLRGAYLSRANLQDVKGLEQFCILPEGELTGYKKLANGSIATLHIPRQAKRVNAYSSRKCRAEYAYVLDGKGVDKHASKTQYAKGTLITPDSYDPDPRVECSHGIHFFITRAEAEAYS